VSILSDVIADVLEERGRQNAKWGAQDHGLLAWNAILGEERGEFEQALLEAVVFDNGRRDRFTLDTVRRELTHVAAVAFAMIECIDRNGVKA
jgi:hypothetical protein